jgi:hypothetical protein
VEEDYKIKATVTFILTNFVLTTSFQVVFVLANIFLSALFLKIFVLKSFYNEFHLSTFVLMTVF